MLRLLRCSIVGACILKTTLDLSIIYCLYNKG
nr:beta-NGF-like family protein [Oriental turtle dovepox virus]